MKRKTFNKKLIFKKSTIATLTNNDLNKIKRGQQIPTGTGCWTYCWGCLRTDSNVVCGTYEFCCKIEEPVVTVKLGN